MCNKNEYEIKKQVRVPTKKIREALKPFSIVPLTEGQEVCPNCNGTKLYIDGSALCFCQQCNQHGAVDICPYCGEPDGFRHDCEEKYKKRNIERKQRQIENERLYYKKAEKIEPYSDKAKKMEFYYSEYYPYNEGYFSDFEELFDAWHEEKDNDKIDRPEYVWSTDSFSIQIDIDDMIERACEDLHENALDGISEVAYKELEEAVGTFNDACEYGTRTYCQSFDYAIRIPWEDCNN